LEREKGRQAVGERGNKKKNEIANRKIINERRINSLFIDRNRLAAAEHSGKIDGQPAIIIRLFVFWCQLGRL